MRVKQSSAYTIPLSLTTVYVAVTANNFSRGTVNDYAIYSEVTTTSITVPAYTTSGSIAVHVMITGKKT